jgi:UDP-glucose 4-epimerase
VPPIAISPELARHFRGTRCLITGGAGFIGSNLTRTLLGCGAQVTVVDNLVTGQRRHLPEAAALTFVESGLCSCPELSDLVSAADYVFHLAAQVGNIKSLEETQTDAHTNILGSVRLLQACRDSALKKVVYSSSSAIYGEAEQSPIDEGHPQKPASFYALSKLTAERYALLASSLWRVPSVCLRYFNVFGLPMENNEYTGVISIFFNRLMGGQPLVIYGDGEQLRGAAGRVYNIGSGSATTVAELAALMNELTARDSEILFESFRAGEVRESLANISSAQKDLGFAPAYDVRRGLAEMWERIRPVATGV